MTRRGLLWAGGLLLLLPLLTAVATLLWFPMSPDPVTQVKEGMSPDPVTEDREGIMSHDPLTQVKEGMTVEEVEALLGERGTAFVNPIATGLSKDRRIAYWWRLGDRVVAVTFSKPYVGGKLMAYRAVTKALVIE